MGLKLQSGRFNPGDHVFVMMPMTNDLIEGHVMFENVGGYTIKCVRPHSNYPEERHHWSHEPSGSFFNRTKCDIIDCSENLILPYGLGAEVLFTGKGGRIL